MMKAREHIENILNDGLGADARTVEHWKLSGADAQLAMIDHRLNSVRDALLALADSIDRLEAKGTTGASNN